MRRYILENMKYDLAKPINLPVWKDPQNFVITKHVGDEAWIYFKCWKEPAIDASFIGSLHFESVWSIDSKRFNNLREYPNTEETDLYSYYLIIPESKYLESLKTERSLHDPDWKKYDKRDYSHFVVESHDYWLNIIASKVTFSKIEGFETKQYFELWEKV